MREELATLRGWQAAGARFALATVVATSSSAPRPPGAVLAVHEDGTVVGSVSGGCVEGAVVEVATEVLATGAPQRVRYGISDDQAFAVGLTCGGTIEVFVQEVTRGVVDLDTLAEAIATDAPIAWTVVIDGDAAGRVRLVTPHDATGELGSSGLEHAVTADARGMLDQGATGVRHYGRDGERRVDDVGVFVHAFAPRPRMIVFGAIDFAGAVASVGRFLGYHVTVCDARARFATAARFPDADEVVVEWPHRYLAATDVDERTVLCVLTHDPKFDVPVLEVALRTEAAYVGVMGSRRTHEDRLARLREAGVEEVALTRLRSPIGLDLGARTPQETAVSIAAEIVQQRYGGSAAPLTATDGPIHRDREDALT
ncbi:XdhC family protein [Nitriliruptoraceae bacterium ZYF776]|nr:XdhC family protein [Profundirhabdus halotolerans]